MTAQELIAKVLELDAKLKKNFHFDTAQEARAEYALAAPVLARMLQKAMSGILHDGCDGGMRCGGCEIESEIDRIAKGEE